MNRVFRVGEGFAVPDGTSVHSVIDPRLLALEKLPGLDQVSLAMGSLPAGVVSKIHVHLIVQHLTWVVSGTLTVKMKDPAAKAPYLLQVGTQEAVLTQPGTFFQLMNQTDQPCQALYIVSPAFVFETDVAGAVRYNDALVLDQSWDELAAIDWLLPEFSDIETVRANRAAACARLSELSRTGHVESGLPPVLE